MLSTLLLILKYLAIILGVVLFLAYFAPMIITWVSWALSTAYTLLFSVPDFVIPLFSVGIVLALISLGVKLL